MSIDIRNHNIPQALKAVPNWMTWSLVNGTKIPSGKSNDSWSWTNFERIKNQEKIAYVFASNCPFTGIDVDDCIVDGDFTEFAREILHLFEGKAYAEISPSGTGIKLWVRAKKPQGYRCQNKNLEVYDNNRFFAVTGEVLAGFGDVGKDATQELLHLLDKYLKPDTTPKPTTSIYPAVYPSISISKRLEEYAETFEPVYEGGRNHKAFNHAGNMRAITDEIGNPPSEDEIIYLLRRWNASNVPPLSDDELLKAIESSARNGSARAVKPPTEQPVYDYSHIDFENLNLDFDTEIDDEEFCLSCIPESGLLRGVFEFYSEVCYRKSNMMGLAVSLSLCQTILGRRVRSHTDLRTNDYNLIIAPTGSGKEACETTITKLLSAADASNSMLLPPDIQSGNGLMHAIAQQPCGIWCCDEFGKILQAILDKKGNLHIKNIGNHLLKLYGKASGVYGGAAHSDGVRNKVVQPHLVLLGLATASTVFSSVGADQVSDGLIGRIAFFPVQDRPPEKESMSIAEPSHELVKAVRSWIEYTPGRGNLNDLFPEPSIVEMTPEALERWKQHRQGIDHKMREESESRAAVWARVAARAMKLALTHRCARLDSMASETDFTLVKIEMEDIAWGIKLANWLARNACSLVQENTVDVEMMKAKALLSEAIKHGPINRAVLLAANRSLTSGGLDAAAKSLGLIKTKEKSGKRGRPPEFYERPQEVSYE
jgi:hypothetical protein